MKLCRRYRSLLIVTLGSLLFRPIHAQTEEGLASYYHVKFHGRASASGYVHDQDDMVAAHRTLPFGTFVRVTNLNNLKSVIVSIMDRGPRKKSRIIDVSTAAAKELGFVRAGITRVRIEVVPSPEDLRFLDLMYPKVMYLPVRQATKEFRITDQLPQSK